MVVRPEIPDKYKEMAKRVYDRHSAYSSMYALRLALEQDDDFKKKYLRYRQTLSGKEGLRRWIKEDWIQVPPYLEKGEVIACGRETEDDGIKIPACRPLRRISKDTPVTINEILKKSSKKEILEEIQKKEKDREYRIKWVKKLYEK